MTNVSTSFKSFMTEGVQSTRWRLYVLRFWLFASFSMAADLALDLPTLHVAPKKLVNACCFSLVLSSGFFWIDRANANHPRSRTVMLAVTVLACALAALLGFLVWHGSRRV